MTTRTRTRGAAALEQAPANDRDVAERGPMMLYRDFDFAVDRDELAKRKQDGADATIPVTMSSEAPVLRYDWWTGEEYYEVLDHSASSIDLSYAKDGVPFIMSHRSRDGDAQHGIVENVRLEKKKLLGDLRMSRAARSQEIRQDILDGVRKKTSIGYIVGEEYEQTASKDGSGIPTRRYTAWMPIEQSVVPVPADYAGSGFARGARGEPAALPPHVQQAIDRYLERHPAAVRSLHPAQRAKDPPMEPTAPAATAPTPAAPAPSAADLRVIEERGRDGERTRVNNITALATQHGCADRMADWISKGASTEDVTREINGILAARLKAPIHTVHGPLNEKEAKRFNYARALMLGTVLEKEVHGIDFTFEREVLAEIEKTGTPQKGGRMLPLMLLNADARAKVNERREDEVERALRQFGRALRGERAGIDSATSTTGGPFKFTQPGDFIELLRNRSSVMRAGATLIPGLTGPVTFPKQTAASTAFWVAENSGSDVTLSNLTTGTVTLSFKTTQVGTAVSRQALFSAASGNYDLEGIIRNDLAAVIALAQDLAALNGPGTANNVLGVLANTNIGSVTLGTNGGTVSWDSIVDLETAIGDANADGSRMAYITNTKQRGRLKKVAVLGNTASGVPIWQGAMGEGTVNGYRALASNQVPRNLTKGTSTTICSAVLFGAYEHLLVGTFGNGFETLVDPYSKKFQNMVEITGWLFMDAALRYDAAFAAIKDAL